MESRVGVSVVNRTTRCMSLPPERERLLEHARRILGEIDAIEPLLGVSEATPKALLRVDATLGFGRSPVAPQIARCVRRHPQVPAQLQRSVNPPPQTAESFDVCTRLGAPPDARVIAKNIPPIGRMAGAHGLRGFASRNIRTGGSPARAQGHAHPLDPRGDHRPRVHAAIMPLQRCSEAATRRSTRPGFARRACTDNPENRMKTCLTAMALLLAAVAATAAPTAYVIDPAHTFPSFEADHMGISVWRGKLNKSRGKVQYDKAAGTGTVEITTELASIDFGMDALATWARGKDFFDVKRHPRAVFKGSLQAPVNGVPTQLTGELTMRGVTRPLTLTVNSLKCIQHPMFKRDYCGADASGSFNRDDFGLSAGKEYGFKMKVDLRIQVEAIAQP
jgi:polyisoprenoid-binding protein YceI